MPVDNSDSLETVKDKFEQLITVSKLLDFIKSRDKVAVKMHFGEEGNTGYVRPEYLRVVCDEIAAKKVTCFISDTNTLYRGKRMNSKDHLKLAHEHGFTKDICGVEVLIPDERKKQNCSEVKINSRFVKIAKVIRLFLEADAIIGVAHFKGHMMTGFGGALKNIGMGCATREGKLAQHSDISPLVVIRKCIGCKECLKVCPVSAILMHNNTAHIERAKCIGCASCIAACRQNAIDVDWESGGSNIQEKMIEYASVILNSKKDKAAFFNFVIKVTRECDCLAKDDPRIVPDIGILASPDPVSVDKASLDLVKEAAGKDIFKEVHPSRDGMKQLNYAHKIGLGNLEYELIEIG